MALVQMFGDKVMSKDGEVDVSSLSDNDAIGIYFSAHWCPPCRMYTPMLAEYYESLKKAGKKFEIVFVSSDQDDASMKAYFAEMPWLAVPHDSPHRMSLGKTYQIQGIPSLVIIDAKSGETIQKNARGIETRDPKGENFPWKDMQCS